jgi:Fe-S-cluster containining protein
VVLEDLEARGYPGDRPACRAGCSTCCHQRVDVTLPEIVALARWLVEHLEEPARAALRRVLAARNEQLLGLDGRAHWARKVRCALLDEQGRCSAYEARPLACRRGHSTRVEACLDAFHHGSTELIPENPSVAANARLLTVGYFEGFAAAGRALGTVELHAGLLLSLDDPDAVEAAWLRGEDPLASATTHDAEDVGRALGFGASSEAPP